MNNAATLLVTQNGCHKV